MGTHFKMEAKRANFGYGKLEGQSISLRVGLVGVLRKVMESVAHSDVTWWQQLTSRLDRESRILSLPLSGCDRQQVLNLSKPWCLPLQDIFPT